MRGYTIIKTTMMTKPESRLQLAHFLQTKRKQLTPEQVGLPRGLRRRAVGLRREEVAQRAAVGVTWYTWLEQGRDIQVSSQALKGIARALCLTEAERTHLFALANTTPDKPTALISTIEPALARLLNTFMAPAYVINQRWDMIACNKIMQRQWNISTPMPNILRWLFLTNDVRQRLEKWDDVVDATVALFRVMTVSFVDEIWFKELLTELLQNSDFSVRWNNQAITRGHPHPRTFLNPGIGRTTTEIHFLSFVQYPDLHLVLHAPLDEQTARLFKDIFTGFDSRSTIIDG